MSIRQILHFPDPRLRRQANPVLQVNDSIRRLLDDMAETMYQAPGIGLAAIQINEPWRIIVIDISPTRDQLQVFINPEILSREGEQELEEGCLSVPGIYEPVTRARRIRVRALNRDGEVIEFEAEDLLATCIQHEIDHLDGKVFVDYLSRLKQTRIRKKLEKRGREQGPKSPTSEYAIGHESTAAAAGRKHLKI
ncbi:MAG TPA: peptide deformylase [Sulfuricaulis sp.]|nr:peptide deformylase [Gammaproteobacteria bacterium]HEU5339095.1 peptide deformylase [Sulfuricaulis sp.]MDH3370065.1 peptide deformylase [Gammaproteobacteria bacterium]MDH3406781.1 peptide deformylase [Gammaproteobacteria bacterium]MDH3562521.1 peptide deformylase [Gammaproteobacteria bacterium]